MMSHVMCPPAPPCTKCHWCTMPKQGAWCLVAEPAALAVRSTPPAAWYYEFNPGQCDMCALIVSALRMALQRSPTGSVQSTEWLLPETALHAISWRTRYAAAMSWQAATVKTYDTCPACPFVLTVTTALLHRSSDSQVYGSPP